jgi:hypothetical protein
MSNHEWRRSGMDDEEEGGRAFDLEGRVVDFAVRIMKLAEALPRTRVGNHVAGQLLRSGTSPAFNYGEVQSAESRNGLLMVQRKPLLPMRKTAKLLAECEELIRIFSSSVRTAEKNRPRKVTSRRTPRTDG